MTNALISIFCGVYTLLLLAIFDKRPNAAKTQRNLEAIAVLVLIGAVIAFGATL